MDEGCDFGVEGAVGGAGVHDLGDSCGVEAVGASVEGGGGDVDPVDVVAIVFFAIVGDFAAAEGARAIIEDLEWIAGLGG